MKPKSFLLYFDYRKHLNLITDSQDFRLLIESIFDYMEYDKLPTKLSSTAQMAFSFIKSNLDRDIEKYNRICERNKKNSKNAGRPKENNNPENPVDCLEIQNNPVGGNTNTKTNIKNKTEILNTNMSHPADKTRVKKQTDYPAWFDDMWTNRAERSGTDSKADCYKACNARLKEGYTVAELVDGMERYRWHCEAVGNIKTAYVMQKSRFFGTSLHFKEDWKINEEQIYADDKSKQFKQQLRAAKEEFIAECGLC